MVYSLDILNNNFNTLTVPQASTSRSVKIYYNNNAIHDITGPTPHLELTSSTERNNLGMPQSYNTKITLIGSIVRTGAQNDMVSLGSGIGPVVSGIQGLQNIFKSGELGTLEVKCDNSTIISWSGCKLSSMSFPQNSNHWVYTSDYTIELEHTQSAITGCNVKSISDTWNLEPIEDYIYHHAQINVTQKVEYDNPYIKPSTPGPSQSQTVNNQGANPVAPVDIDIISIPQYKISRTISAVGLPSGTGVDAYTTAWLSAKNCVDSRLAQTYTTSYSGPSGSIHFDTSSNTSNIIPFLKGNGYLYNYVKTTNFNIYDGSYEIIETYLAMPTGIGYSEDYTIDMSTDDKYIATVRVQGTIKGLNVMNTGDIAPSVATGIGSNNTNIDLSKYGEQLEGDFSSSVKIPDNLNYTSNNSRLFKSKYINAVSGWIYDIKPYLYRRACVAMNSKDRMHPYINPALISGPPKNPTYSKQNVLSIIPVNTSETHDPRKGTISYTYEFNNKFTIISGVLYENISITDNGPTDVVGEAFVLGRALGPVLQNLGTKTASKKTINIEIGVVPPSSLPGFIMTKPDCPLYTGGSVYSTIETLIEGFKPFGDRSSIFGNAVRTDQRGQVYLAENTQSWDPNNGRYTRNVGWIYQQCDNSKQWFDN